MDIDELMNEIKRQHAYWKELSEHEDDKTTFLMYKASQCALFDVICVIFDYDENKASLFLNGD